MLAAILDLTKVRITVAVTLSVAAGHLLFTRAFTWGLLLPVAGVFLLACGCAALNQVQDARVDRLMLRTARRPIPAGRIGADWALFIAVLFMGAAFSVLSFIEAHTLTILGLAALAVLWYNGVYALLKRFTAFAVVPGALVGALPPLIGWSAAGGLLFDRAILDVAFFFFIWQIPHFWLLLLLHGADYERAGLPSLTRVLSRAQVGRITCMWIVALALTGPLLAVTGKVHLPWNVGILAASAWLFFKAFPFLRESFTASACLPAFVRVNAYALLVALFLSGSALW